jgi:hypothetical protein
MRKTLICVLICIFTLTGCSNKLNKNNLLNAGIEGIQVYEHFLTFEDIVQNSNVAIVGRYIETIESENYIEQKFEVSECLYGDVTDPVIYLYSDIGTGYIEEIDYTYKLGDDIYDTGKDYILVMEKAQSVMYDHDRYMLATDIFLCEDTNEYTLYAQSIDFPDDMSIREYISSLHQSVASAGMSNSDMSYQNNIEEMVVKSEFVGEVKIQELVNESKVHNGNTYRCIVESLYKGENLNTYNDSTILIVILKNTVEVNNTYIIGFSPADENSLIYTQTTDYGVYEVSEKVLDEINDYLQD